jgi:hypothetical protein
MRMILCALVTLAACSLDADYTGTYYQCGPNGESGRLPLPAPGVHPSEPDRYSTTVAAGGNHSCIVHRGDGSV